MRTLTLRPKPFIFKEIRNVSYISRGGRPGRDVPAPFVASKLHVVLAPYVAVSRPRTSDVVAGVLGDIWTRFERFRHGKDLSTAILSACIVENSQRGLERYLRLRSSGRLQFESAGFLEGYHRYSQAASDVYLRVLSDLGVGPNGLNVASSGSEEHAATRNDIWSSLIANSAVFRGHYDGWFSWHEESYVSENADFSEIVLGRKAKLLTTKSGTAVSKTKQVAFIFRFSKHRKLVLESLLTENQISPSFRAELLKHVHKLPDTPLSVPLNRFPSGEKVPQDRLQAFHASFDSFCTLIAASRGEHWPPDMQLVHPDPAGTLINLGLLHALELPLPKKIWAVSADGSDGSLDARELIRAGGRNPVRFLFATLPPRAHPSHDRLLKSWNEFVGSYNALLDELWGRSGGVVPLTPGYQVLSDTKFEESIRDLPFLFSRLLLDDLNPPTACKAVLDTLTETRRYLTHGFSLLSGTHPDRARTLLYNAFESLRVCLMLLDSCVVPGLFGGMLDAIGVPAGERTFDKATQVRVGADNEDLHVGRRIEDSKLPEILNSIPLVDADGEKDEFDL